MGKFKRIFAILVFLLFLAIRPALAEFKVPNYVGYVNDYAGVISDGEEAKMDAVIRDLKNKTGAEIAVVTLKSLDGYPIEDAGLTIGRKWGVGQKGKDNGLLILVAPSDRKMRIEVGYGLEGYITDAHAGRIRDQYMIPYFKQGNYELGIVNGTLATADAIAKRYGVELSGNYSYRAPVTTSNSGSGQSDPLFNFLFMAIFLYMAIKHPRILLFMLLTSGRGGGRSSGGFGGSSFGGFGGGGFGGGGASGGW